MVDTSLSLNVRGEEKKMSWKSRGEVSSKSSVSRKCTLFLCLGCFCAGLLFTNRYKWVFSHMGFWLVPSFLHFYFILFISVVGVSDFVRNSVLGSVLLDFLLSSSSIYLFYWCIISWYGCEWFFRNCFVFGSMWWLNISYVASSRLDVVVGLDLDWNCNFILKWMPDL